MSFLVQLLGVGLVIISLSDIYLTVLYPRLGSSWIGSQLGKRIWQLFLLVARAIPGKGDRLLSYCGPTLVVVVVVVWVALLINGFALIFWTELGTSIQTSEGQTPTDFFTALFLSGSSITTLGPGSLMPKTGIYQLLIVLETGLGFSTFTLTITYLLSVYSALIRRNTFALSLHHQTAGIADAAEVLARLGADGNLNSAQQNISDTAKDLINLLESQHSYPVLLYFRFRQTYYAIPRILLLAMDTATLIKSALNQEKHRPLVYSTAVAELWGGGLQLLTELSGSFMPKRRPKIDHELEQVWRQRYYQVVARLQSEGIETAVDLEAGANSYISLRYQWGGYLTLLTNYLAYEWSEVAPAENYN